MNRYILPDITVILELDLDNLNDDAWTYFLHCHYFRNVGFYLLEMRIDDEMLGGIKGWVMTLSEDHFAS